MAQVAAPTTTNVTVSIPQNHPNFDKFMAILSALEPVILVGISPFVKNPDSQNIIAHEAPVAKTLFDALSQL